MSKTKIIVLVVMLALTAVLFFGSSESKTTADEKDYGQFSEMNRRKGQLKVFPQPIPDGAVCEKYYYSSLVPPILTAKYQVYLKLKFSDEAAYGQEIQRIGKISKAIKEDNENFARKAYVAMLNKDSTYEYALCNDEENVIEYVYLQSVSQSSVEFDTSCLPKNYGSEKNAFSIYE